MQCTVSVYTCRHWRYRQASRWECLQQQLPWSCNREWIAQFPLCRIPSQSSGQEISLCFPGRRCFWPQAKFDETLPSTCPLMRGSLITGCQELAGLLKMLLALQLPGLEYFTDPSLQRRRRLFSLQKLLLHYITS